MSDDSSRSRLEAFLHEHPRLIGWLFATAVALTQAGAVAASNSSGTPGP